MGKTGVDIENDKKSLFLDVLNKKCKIFSLYVLFNFVLYKIITFYIESISKNG